MENGKTDRSKPLLWVASSRKDFKEFPEDVQDEAGYDLWLVQQGGMPATAKVLKGFGGPDVLELVEEHASDTYRVVYTVRFSEAVYVLHAFQKKSKHGIRTPKKELDLVKSRLQVVGQDYRQRHSNGT
jgi:phage-related protein